MNDIHSTAIVSPEALLGENVKIGAYAIVEAGAQLGDGCVVEAHARVCSAARLGRNCRVCSFALVGGEPQDLHFDSSIKSYVQIGDGTVLRESSTVHRATFEGKSTIVGKDCFLMASSHVGHDCVVGDRVIIANFAALAGHVVCDDDVFVSGGVMIHQRVRIGEGAIISGNSASSLDIPPYTIAHARNQIGGLNLIGMNRRKMPRADIAEVKHLYSLVYANTSARKNALALIESGAAQTAAGKKFLEFFSMPNRHYNMPREGWE